MRRGRALHRRAAQTEDGEAMNDARAQRPTPGPNAAMFLAARRALSNAQHAGDPQYAARILMQAAARLAAYDRQWSRVRPPLGVPREQSEAA